MSKRFVSSLFTEDMAFAIFVRTHGHDIAEAFGVPEGHVPVADDLLSDDLDAVPPGKPAAKRRRRKGGGEP